MIKIQKMILSGIAIAAIAATATAGRPAQAAPRTPVAFLSDNTVGWNTTWTGGVGGRLSVTIPNGFIISKVGGGNNFNVTITIGGVGQLIGTGAAGYFFPVTAAGGFNQTLTGGNFTVTDNVTLAVLLQGTFANAVLRGTNGASSASLTLLGDTVTYTNVFNPFFPAGLNKNLGTVCLELTSLGGAPIAANAGGCNAFNGTSGMTFETQ